MLIDRTHRRGPLRAPRVLAAAAVALPGCGLAFGPPWSGGSAIGLAYGIIGFGMMVFAGLLSVRKKLPIWRIGRAQTWMRGHLWLGLAEPAAHPVSRRASPSAVR